MQRRMIPAVIVIASISHIGSAYAQNCPDLGANGQEICVVASAGTVGPVIFRGPSPLVIAPNTVIGDYTINNLTFTLTQGTGLVISATGTVTKSGSDNTTITMTAHGGLSDVPIGEGVTALSLVGTATGTSMVQLGGGAGFDVLGLGEPQIRPVLGSITQPVLNYSGFPLGFGDATEGEPVDAGAVSVALILAININDVGDSVTVPALGGVGPGGLASGGPLGGEGEYLLLPVPSPDGPVEYFSMDQFYVGSPERCPVDHYHPIYASVESIEGSELSDPDPTSCGFGRVSELTVKNVDLVAEDTTLTDDLIVPDGYDLVIGPDATLTIPEGIAAFVSGEVVVLGTLIVDGELLNSDGGTLTNSGNLDVGGLIVNNPEAVIYNDPGATITNTSNTIDNFGTIDNRGTIDNTGRITNQPGGTLSGDGTVTGNDIVEIADPDPDGDDNANDNATSPTGGTLNGCGGGGMCGALGVLFLPMTLIGMVGARWHAGRRARR